MTRNRWRVLAVAASFAATTAIVSTYRVFSQTFDEPFHLASGIEWLSTGRYHYETQHPPLARVMAAVGPYVRGARSLGKVYQVYEGQLLLGEGEEYRTRLALARLGELPFFLLLCGVVWLWGRRLGGEATGALAVLFVATNPNILAHAGLATTDIGATATMVAALYVYARWRERPTNKRAAVLGLGLGLAAATKFSLIPFLGLTLLGAEFWHWVAARRNDEVAVKSLRRDLPQLGIAALCSFALLWATYRFSFGPASPQGASVPAPELIQGMKELLLHATKGHAAFLLGETSQTGWWYYFPVALAVKTPLPLLLFGFLGAVAVINDMRARRSFESALPLIGCVAVLFVGMVTHIDIGIRHVLPLYPLMALLAARGVVDLWEYAAIRRARGGRVAVGALVCSTMIITARAHPDFLPYFNPLAGPHPERVLVDSNLDWGQDLYRLGTVVRRLRIDSLRVAYFGSADLRAAGVPNARRLGRHERATGWLAASQSMLAGIWMDTSFAWLKRLEPVGTVGPSLLLYHLPSDGQASGSNSGVGRPPSP